MSSAWRGGGGGVGYKHGQHHQSSASMAASSSAMGSSSRSPTHVATATDTTGSAVSLQPYARRESPHYDSPIFGALYGPDAEDAQRRSVHSLSMSDWLRDQPMSVLRLTESERLVRKIADERDASQKKTFTKWINMHLKKAAREISDLFTDLRDGFNLIALLEVLSQESLPREKGLTRFHRLQNAQTCLDYLHSRGIRTVNIRAEDIIAGNPKLTLGLIWTIILHFQVSEPWGQQGGDIASAKQALLEWARRVTAGYPGVNVRNFTNSWRDGLAFNAVMHRYRPTAIDWVKISSRDRSNRERLDNAFAAAEREYGVTRLLDPEDVDVEHPDEKSLITYVSSLYDALPNTPEFAKYEQDMDEYSTEARQWLSWVREHTRIVVDMSTGELERFRSAELIEKANDKQRLADHYAEMQRLFAATSQLRIDDELSTQSLDRAWNKLLAAMEGRAHERAGAAAAADAATRLHRLIESINEKLDSLLNRIESAETRLETTPAAEMKSILDKIADDLNALEAPVADCFAIVEQLKQARHPDSTELYQRVHGVHQRRVAYLQRIEHELFARINQISERRVRAEYEKYERTRSTVFQSCEQCIEWIEERLRYLADMEFRDELDRLEEMFEQHKIDHREIMDFRDRVDQCIARQAEVSAEDSAAYCDLLSTLESDYQQLRDLSTGRMLDLDSLIAFVRAAQRELVWINAREELEVTRNWSDVNQLDLPMLANYYKQLLHEIELRDQQFNDVHNQGAALLNQGHPAVQVIEAYVNTMQSQWDWLLSLAKCFEQHLADASNVKQFMEEARSCETWMERQTELLQTHYDRRDVSLDEGDKLLQELKEIHEMLDRYEEMVQSLYEQSRNISPMWQRGERISTPMLVAALCDYNDRTMSVRRGDDCRLLDNDDLIKWRVRGADGAEGQVPSVVFRFPPPDERLVAFLTRLQTQFDRLRRLWTEKTLMMRAYILINTMRTVQSWTLEDFLKIDPEQREAIVEALRDDVNKLVAEMPPNDPMAIRLKEMLAATMEHYYKLLQLSQKEPEPDYSALFDERLALLLARLDEAWRELNERVHKGVPRNNAELEPEIVKHKQFEDNLQSLDTDVTALQELFRQIADPTPMQRTKMEQLNGRWEDMWELSRMYVERLKALEAVLNGIDEAAHMIKEHEIFLGSVETMPADLSTLRQLHGQILELNMTLQQQQPVMDDLASSIGQLRQHVARTRYNVADHPDVDRLEDDVQKLTVRWENVCSQVLERFKSIELALQVLMVYRSDYENEITWLDRVEATINSLRDPETLAPEQYQAQLDILMAEYSQLQERTEAIENVNQQGGKYMREAQEHDGRLTYYTETLEQLHGPGIRSLLHKPVTPATPGHIVVKRELEELNRRFASLANIILERRNVVQVLLQNWRRQQQVRLLSLCSVSALLAVRHNALLLSYRFPCSK